MKKLSIAVVAAAAIVMGACSGAPTAKFNNDVDTFSYAFGQTQAQGLKQYMAMRLGIDTSYIDDFLKGVADGARMGSDTAKLAYMNGMQVGQQISNQWVKGLNYQITGNDSTDFVNLDNILAGFISGAKGDTAVMNNEEAQRIFEEGMENFQRQRMMSQYGENKAAGERKMAEVAQKEGVQSLGDGVYYEVITEGKGAVPADTSTVAIKYVGTLLVEGTEFDRSRNDEPYKSRANQFIPGFTKALTAMPAGSKWKVYIPQEQAYGERQMGQINPFSALVFELELVSVE